MRRPSTLLAAILSALCFVLAGCRSTIEWAGIELYYAPAPLAADHALRDLPYWQGPDRHPVKHDLDLYLPESGGGWPVFVFVHGGGWTEGDKEMLVADADIYGNIGRFFAGQGVATAVINYRLQPEVGWREQVEDVARAAAWAYRHAERYGADRHRLFLGGHSAGGQLAAHVALDPLPLAEHGLTPDMLCGVVSVSGAGFDLADLETYQLGGRFQYYERRFRESGADASWQVEGSPIRLARPGAPPFLFLNAAKEPTALHRQSRLMSDALERQGVESRIVLVPQQSHLRMVLAMSREDRGATAPVLDFLTGTRCGGGRFAGGGTATAATASSAH